MTDTDMLYMASLEKRNAELEAKVAELEGKHWNECGQIAHYDDELRRTKELLKAAVEDMTGMQFGKECKVCSKKLLPNECPIHNNVACILEKDFKWRYADKALAVIGEDTNVPASEVWKMNNEIKKYCEHCKFYGVLGCRSTLICKDGNRFSAADVQPADRWIKADVSLPVYDGMVLVCDKSKNIRLGIYTDMGWCSQFGNPMMCKITHWQPLPEPPKEGDT